MMEQLAAHTFGTFFALYLSVQAVVANYIAPAANSMATQIYAIPIHLIANNI